MTRGLSAFVAAIIFFLFGAPVALGQDPTPTPVAPVAIEADMAPSGVVAVPQGFSPAWTGPKGSSPDGTLVCARDRVPAVSGTPDAGEQWGPDEQAILDRQRADRMLNPKAKHGGMWYIAAMFLDNKAAVWCVEPEPPAPVVVGPPGTNGTNGKDGKDGRDMMFTLALTGGASFINNPHPTEEGLLPVGFGRLEGAALLPLNEGSAAIGPLIAGTAGQGGQYAGEVGGRFVAFPGQLAALSLSAGYFHEKTGWKNALYDYALNGAVVGAGLVVTPRFDGKPVGASLVLAVDGLVYEAGNATAAEAPWGIGGRGHMGVSLSF